MHWIALTLAALLPLGRGTGWESMVEGNVIYFLIPFCAVWIFTMCIYKITKIMLKSSHNNQRKEENLRQSLEENSMKICLAVAQGEVGSQCWRSSSMEALGNHRAEDLPDSSCALQILIWPHWPDESVWCIEVSRLVLSLLRWTSRKDSTRIRVVFCKQEQRQKGGSGREIGRRTTESGNALGMEGSDIEKGCRQPWRNRLHLIRKSSAQ